MTNGPSWYAGYGTETSKGTKTFSLVGKVRRSGLIEVPLGMSLREVIYEVGAGSPASSRQSRPAGPRAAAWTRSTWTRRSTMRTWRRQAPSWVPAA